MKTIESKIIGINEGELNALRKSLQSEHEELNRLDPPHDFPKTAEEVEANREFYRALLPEFLRVEAELDVVTYYLNVLVASQTANTRGILTLTRVVIDDAPQYQFPQMSRTPAHDLARSLKF